MILPRDPQTRRRSRRRLVCRRQFRPRRALRPPRRDRRQHPDGGERAPTTCPTISTSGPMPSSRGRATCIRALRGRPSRDRRMTAEAQSARLREVAAARGAVRARPAAIAASARRWRSTTRSTSTISSPGTTGESEEAIRAFHPRPRCRIRLSSVRRRAKAEPVASRWYVDPIDGTSNFASGIAFWCVSVGAVIDDEIVAGVIYDPVAGHLFSADLTGAWLERCGRSAPVPSRTSRQATLITGYPVARDFRLDGREKALDRFATLAETFSTLAAAWKRGAEHRACRRGLG